MSFSYPIIDIYERIGCKAGNNELYIPYFANLYATNLILSEKEYPEVIKEYIFWYVENLNYPDNWEFTGTIYNFYLKDGVLLPTYSYDSADAYAGSFLTLLYFYIRKTKDFKILNAHLKKFKDIAYIIISLKDNRDGLIRALPYKSVKYLIDNLESYVGLLLFSQLLREISDGDWYYYRRHALELKRSIKKHFYSKGVLYWAIEDGIKYKVENQIYPDYLALIFWKIFNGKSLSQRDLLPLDCSQIIAVKVFSAAYLHTFQKV